MTTHCITVPLHVEHDRPFVDLDVVGNDGHARQVRFWVDTGGGAIILTESLAREVGIPLAENPPEQREDEAFERIVSPRLLLGGEALNQEQMETFVAHGRRTTMAGTTAEGMLPGRLLARYCVTFDYPHHQFMLATPGSARQQGERFFTPVHAETGFLRIEVEIAGNTYGLLLDTGASCTMLSSTLLQQLIAEHPDWPRASGGAVGTANMGARETDERVFMLRLPQLRVGPYLLEEISVVSRPAGTFEHWLSQWTTEPVVGALAGNVLKLFRTEIDYASGLTYIEQQAPPDQHDMDLVGLTLLPNEDGTYTVIALSDCNDPRVIKLIQVGDSLLQIDEKDIHGWPLAQVINALRGELGQIHTLLIDREGMHLTIEAPTARLL